MGDLGTNPELEFLDTEMADVSEFPVTGTNITVGRIILNTVKVKILETIWCAPSSVTKSL